jgi:hypothetical protein
VDGGVLAGRFREGEALCAMRSRKRLRRSTFQVNTMIREDHGGTSSNVVIGREKFSSNLRV